MIKVDTREETNFPKEKWKTFIGKSEFGQKHRNIMQKYIQLGK